jgi:hypothetical protein
MASNWGRFYILAGGFVGKFLVQGQPFELADLVLIQGADAQVADPLAFGRLAPSSGPTCPNRLFNLRHYLYDNAKIDSIATLFRQVSDVGLGYTQTTRQNLGASGAQIREVHPIRFFIADRCYGQLQTEVEAYKKSGLFGGEGPLHETA